MTRPLRTHRAHTSPSTPAAIRRRGVVIAPLEDLALLRAPAADLAIEGVHLGDDVTRLDTSRFFVHHPDEAREAFERALSEGGWVRTSRDIAFELAHHRVRRIFLCGAAVASLVVERAHDITGTLGEPTGLSWQLGARGFHYVHRDLEILWHPTQQRVLGVTLGPCEWREPEHGALELVRELVEHWSPIVTPRRELDHMRRRRVEALAAALGHSGLPALLHDRGTGSVHEGLDRLRRHHAERASTQEQAQRELDARGREELDRLEAEVAARIAPHDKRVRHRELVNRWGWPDVDLVEMELGLW